jgi:hypothetical protein
MRSGRQSQEGAEVVKSLRDGFVEINMRWDVAGVYLQLLEAQEAIRLGT